MSSKQDLRKAEFKAFFRAVGKHIEWLRKAQDMTQADLARILGVSQQTVFAYELGDRRISLLVAAQLSRIFSITLDQFVGADRKPPRARVPPHLLRQVERLQRLNRRQQRFVSEVIEVLLAEHSEASERRRSASLSRKSQP